MPKKNTKKKQEAVLEVSEGERHDLKRLLALAEVCNLLSDGRDWYEPSDFESSISDRAEQFFLAELSPDRIQRLVELALR